MEKALAFTPRPVFIAFMTWARYPTDSWGCMIEVWTGRRAVIEAVREAARWARVWTARKFALLKPFYLVYYFIRELRGLVRNANRIPEWMRTARYCGCRVIHH